MCVKQIPEFISEIIFRFPCVRQVACTLWRCSLVFAGILDMEDFEMRATSVKKSFPSRKLRALASAIRRIRRRSVADVVAMGKLLLEAKKIARHGKFQVWLRRSTSLAPRTAQDAMIAARRIKVPAEQLQHCLPSTARVLSRSRVYRNPAITAKALETPLRNGKIGYRDMMSHLSWIDPDICMITEPLELPEEKLGRQLMALAENPAISTIHISLEHDPNELNQTSITIMGDKSKSVSRCSLEQAMSSIVGEEKLFHCPCCGKDRPASFFSKECHNCKKCDRLRSKENGKKRRSKNRADKKRIAEL